MVSYPRIIAYLPALLGFTDPPIVNVGGIDYYRFVAAGVLDTVRFKFHISDTNRARIVAKYLWSGSPVDMLDFHCDVLKWNGVVGDDEVKFLWPADTFTDPAVMLKGSETILCELATAHEVPVLLYTWIDSFSDYLFKFYKTAPITGVDLYVRFEIVPLLPSEIPMDRPSIVGLETFNDTVMLAMAAGVPPPPSTMSIIDILQYCINEFCYMFLLFLGDPIPDSILIERWLMMPWYSFLHP